VVTIDTDTPAAPSAPDLAAGSDTGTSCTDNIEPDVRAWRIFWATDGVLFKVEEGRDAACELIERALRYYRETVMDRAADTYMAHLESREADEAR
jgi:hypothetical protein